MMDIDEQKELVELLQNLVRINSENPPGNENDIAIYIKEYLSKNEIDSEIVPLSNNNRSSLVAKLPGKELKNIAFCGHLDTVRVENEHWSMPPFEGLIDGNRMYGRGTSDMKGGIAAAVYSTVLLKRKKIVPQKTIMIALTADEEWGYGGAKVLTEKGFFDQTDFLIIAEPTNSNVAIAEKGELWISIKLFGKSAHGSTPEVGINTVIPGSKLIIEITKRIKEIFKEDSFLGKSTINVGQIHGGTQVNIVPSFTEIQLDFRVITEEDKENTVQLIKAISDDISIKYKVKVEIDIFNYKEPIISSPDNFYIKKFKKATGVEKFTVAKYCTDGAIIVPAQKIPFVIYGPGNIEQAHQNDEYIELGSLYQSVDNFLNFLIDI